MKRILVLSDWFDPAFKAGGPIRSCVNFVGHLHADFDLYVFTSSHDLHATSPLPVKTGEWLNYKDQAKVYYAPPQQVNASVLINTINGLAPDYIYLNGLFSKQFTAKVNNNV